MKVEELIKELEKMPKDGTVRIQEEGDMWEHPIIHLEEECDDVLIIYRDE